MLTDFTIYSLVSGQILQTGRCEPHVLGYYLEDDDMGLLQTTSDGRSHYVLDGVPTQRPEVTPMTGPSYDLSLLQTGAKLIVVDEVGVSTDVLAQNDVLELVDVGTYYVKSFSPFPWLDFETEVTV